MLERFGLTERQDQLYTALIHEPQLTLDELATRVGSTRAHAQRDLQRIIEAGLVTAVQDGGPFSIADPEAAIGVLVRREQESLARVRVEAAQLAQTLRTARQVRNLSSFVEVITGADAIEEHWRQAQRDARHRVRMTDRPPYYSGNKPENLSTQDQRMAEGIDYQVLYDQAILEYPEHLQRAFRSIEGGEDARVMANVPIKLAMVDASEALVVLLNSSDNQEPAVIIVHPSALLDSLSAFFDLLWERGLALRRDQPLEDAVSRHRELLSMLAAGLKDEAIAIELDVAVRTVRRRIGELYELLGVKTRFQAGAAAMKRGWL